MEEIHVKFEVETDGKISMVYIPDQTQILHKGQKYKIVFDSAEDDNKEE